MYSVNKPRPVIRDLWTVTCEPWPATRDPRPVTRDLWPATCDPWPVTCDPWPVTCDLWPVTRDPWPVTRDPWPVTSDPWPVTRDLWNRLAVDIFNTIISLCYFPGQLKSAVTISIGDWKIMHRYPIYCANSFVKFRSLTINCQPRFLRAVFVLP